ncbi:hypothetical protein [Flectobacillus roseus]|uniref:hypothetical protein n=1 Tax=Flectobacillus roseus TaxID=502259 RepID=UPI0024B84D63|nr:hypothetical protein [Flectobacillus roseus]MDI9871691.1 hypothetical protein [Flectobacillus roseus]
MKNLLLFATATFFVACSQSEEMAPLSYNVSANADFTVTNAQSQDLLDPSNPNHLDASKIKVFYVTDGQIKEINNPLSDYPKGYRIYKPETATGYRITVFLNHLESVEKPITYIRWNDTDIDTIQATFKKSTSGTMQDMIWLNGKKVWERGDGNTEPLFVKQN